MLKKFQNSEERVAG